MLNGPGFLSRTLFSPDGIGDNTPTGGAPATSAAPPADYTLSEDDFRRELRSAIRDEMSSPALLDTIRGLMTDTRGPAAADAYLHARGSAQSAWDAMTSAQRTASLRGQTGANMRPDAGIQSLDASGIGAQIRQWRQAIFQGGAQDIRRSVGGQAIRFGSGLLFSEYVLHHMKTGSKQSVHRMATADDANMSPELRVLLRQLNPDDIAAGGAFVPNPVSLDFIAFLYAKTLLRTLGSPMTMDLSLGSITLPRGGASAVVGWLGTTDTSNVSEETFEQVRMSAHKLGGRVRISNDLVRRGTQNAVQIVRRDLVAQMALAEDIAAYRGDGLANQPTGLTNEAGVTITNSAGITQANKITDLLGAQERLRAGNVLIDEPVWAMSVRSEFGLKSTLTTDGAWFFLPEMSQGTLLGEAFGSTSAFPTNLAPGTGAEMIYYESTEEMIGETLNMEVREQEADTDFARDLRTVRGLHEVDFRIRNPEAVQVIDAVLY